MKKLIYIVIFFVIIASVLAIIPSFLKPDALVGQLTDQLISQLPPDLTTAYNFATNPTAIVGGKIKSELIGPLQQAIPSEVMSIVNTAKDPQGVVMNHLRSKIISQTPDIQNLFGSRIFYFILLLAVFFGCIRE